MSDLLAANKAVAYAYVSAFDRNDLDAIEKLLADDFLWHTAVVGDGETTPRPFQSPTLCGLENTMYGAILKGKAETLSVFKRLFDAGAANPAHYFHLRAISLTAEDDRVAVEALGDGRNPMNERRYRNIYFILMRIRDGQVARYKEYQDTLHIYDVWQAE
ncbi:nuclear transport factor 2 family protein [Frankia sp. CNm7]|uniref:Nuclear transport factor 2 family protein n=1 Tax=Frankia nepalensis TaxID=1836974 RepID=A0A937URD6_9ACTN|nr:nuclear transport factor 2 family protein [Frankia nepalensis]MBL7500997.1 nuclear transport factor 2 family protein [Frankia nepalensis]MBL7512457.1 nuclear transport factor 2 family protein [Frankia nepalensis]MBL7521522.1 nuclear transport factor 2 family protein [Frankia nepalensis]MBL7632759.1 nuclear transport factor 2 family protein [Frankia nepalensis]